ncbi:MAG: DUF4162 domain-containing protein, partial [Myxococcales bacterium]|nr:DUF4162 domain-containing protein [Myxococcales bacterium]
VEIAKGLLHRPAVLLLDEPSTGLDPRARRYVWEHLEELRARDGITVVLTTHLMDEAETCDRLGILHRGRLVALGSPQDLKREIGGEVVSIEAAHPDKLAEEIGATYGVEAQVVGRTVRVERSGAHAFVAELAGRYGAELGNVTIGKPTLEDVFIHRTGTDFWSEGASAAAEEGDA